jgi:hypothetical protein
VVLGAVLHAISAPILTLALLAIIKKQKVRIAVVKVAGATVLPATPKLLVTQAGVNRVADVTRIFHADIDNMNNRTRGVE